VNSFLGVTFHASNFYLFGFIHGESNEHITVQIVDHTQCSSIFSGFIRNLMLNEPSPPPESPPIHILQLTRCKVA
jgi:hypothetical protein